MNLWYAAEFTEWLRLEGTTGCLLVQTPCSSRDPYSMLLRIVSRWLLSNSREGDSATSLGILFQSSVTLTVKKIFLMSRWNLLYFSFSFCLSSYWSAPLRRSWLHTLDTLPSDTSVLFFRVTAFISFQFECKYWYKRFKKWCQTIKLGQNFQYYV